MKSLFAGLMVAASMLLAWLAWNPSLLVQSSEQAHRASALIPSQQPKAEVLWQVMTRRMVWKQGVDDMKVRLQVNGLQPMLLKRKEPVELHTYDDVQLFNDFSVANQAKQQWQQAGFEADVLETGESLYRVGLGRFYLTEYAEELEQRLKKFGKPYRYEQRTVVIPAYRFVFPAMRKSEADKLWHRLQELGVGNPILIKQSEYVRLYGKKK